MVEGALFLISTFYMKTESYGRHGMLCRRAKLLLNYIKVWPLEWPDFVDKELFTSRLDSLIKALDVAKKLLTKKNLQIRNDLCAIFC